MDFKNLVLVAVAATSGAARADEPVTVKLDMPVYSNYVWRGINFIDDPVFQPSANLAWHGWNLNFWGDYDINGSKRFDEWDTTVSYSASGPQGSWSLGYIDYAFPLGPIRTAEIYGSYTFSGQFSPTIQVNMDIDEADKAVYGRFGASHQLDTPVGAIGLGGWVGYGNRTHNSYYYGNGRSGFADFGIEATLTRTLFRGTDGYLKVGYAGLLDSKNRQGAPNRTNFTFGIGFTAGF